MGMRDLVTGHAGCAAPGSSSSANPVSASPTPCSAPPPNLSNIFLQQQRKEHSGSAVCGKASFDSMPASLSTLPGSEDETKLGQGPIRSMKGTDFINGCHGDACGENFQASILSVPEHRVIEPHLGEPEQIDDATGVNFEPKFDGPPEMAVPTHCLKVHFNHTIYRKTNKKNIQQQRLA
ncbi:hypothetical protein ZWY2020_038216 [Hordeum vulgare]|nr:hypothetical protein ZWY2020_038216 [Hordeum vulgare]